MTLRSQLSQKSHSAGVQTKTKETEQKHSAPKVQALSRTLQQQKGESGKVLLTKNRASLRHREGVPEVILHDGKGVHHEEIRHFKLRALPAKPDQLALQAAIKPQIAIESVKQEKKPQQGRVQTGKKVTAQGESSAIHPEIALEQNKRKGTKFEKKSQKKTHALNGQNQDKNTKSHSLKKDKPFNKKKISMTDKQSIDEIISATYDRFESKQKSRKRKFHKKTKKKENTDNA